MRRRAVLRTALLPASLLLAVLLLAAWRTPNPAPARPPAAVPGFLAGVAMTELHPGHDPAAYARALDAIRDLGAAAVLLPVYGYVDSAAAATVDTLFEPPTTPTEYRACVARRIREAHARGLAVLLIPYLNVRHDHDVDWRGNLRPPDWPRWFAGYEAWLADWVALARAERVEMLAVGAELLTAEEHEDAWRALIARTRTAYGGRLLYSANWDHYDSVPFVDALDLVGVSAYYSLPWDAPTTFAAFRDNWRGVRDALVAYARLARRPLILTEIGFPSVRSGYRDPWNYLQQGPPAPDEQAEAFRIFVETWRGVPELGGAFVWCLSPFQGGMDDTGYSIAGKPATGVVRDWFRAAGR